MRLIIIEGTAYKVTEKEFVEIRKLEIELEAAESVGDYKRVAHANLNLANFLDENKENFEYVDEVWFHYQI